MAPLTSWRAGLVPLFAILVFTLTPIVSAQNGTPAADHEVHHTATPGSGSACVNMATPSADGAMGMGTPAMSMMGTPAMGDIGMMMDPEQFDLIFIDLMLSHHEGAVAMARIAMERGERPEIIQLAEEINRAQEQEIDQLTTWRDTWFPNAPAFTMDQMRGGMAMMDSMSGTNMMDGMDMMTMMDPEVEAAKMCAASEPFDLAFIDAMIPHHQSAIMMAEAATQHSTHPEIQDLSRVIIDSQTREIEQMQGWRDAWYGEATPSGS